MEKILGPFVGPFEGKPCVLNHIYPHFLVSLPMFTPWYIAIVTLPLVKLLGSILHMELLWTGTMEPRPAQRVVITHHDCLRRVSMSNVVQIYKSVQYPQHGFLPLKTKDDQHLFSYIIYRKYIGNPIGNPLVDHPITPFLSIPAFVDEPRHATDSLFVSGCFNSS